ncbi:MAG: DUF3991 and toprim domain-containing protein [Oscillospiraceae bacterium]
MNYVEKGKKEIQLIKNIPIETYANYLGFTLVDKGKYISLKEHDSVMIDKDKNKFNRYSNGVNGDIIDFAQEFTNMSISQCINDLKSFALIDNNYINKTIFKETIPKKQNDKLKEKIILPKKDINIKNIYAYLVSSRCIDKWVVSNLIKNRNLYQDVNKNCVFVSYDKNKKVKFACTRGSNNKYKFIGDIKNSDYNHCFFIDNNASTLIVTESVIDSMSIMTLLINENKNIENYNFLALSGVSKINSVKYHIESKPNINKLILALDNDTSGRLATQKIKDLLKDCNITKTEFLPPNYKDWNEELIHKIPSIDNKIEKAKDILNENKNTEKNTHTKTRCYDMEK